MINSGQKANLKRRLKRLRQELDHQSHCMIAREKISPALQESIDRLFARVASESRFHRGGDKTVKAIKSDHPMVILPCRENEFEKK